MKYRIVELSNRKFLAQYKTLFGWSSFRIDSFNPHFTYETHRYVEHDTKAQAEYSVLKHSNPEAPIHAVAIYYPEVKCPK